MQKMVLNRNANMVMLILVLVLSGCTLEVKECQNGETRCVGESINTCEDGEWSKYSPCEKKLCAEPDGIASCVNICEKGDTICSNDVLLTCTEDNMWPVVSQGTACASGEHCMSVQGFSFCANPNSSNQIVEKLLEHDIECNDALRLCGENNTLYTCENGALKELEQCGSQICGQGLDGMMACLDICQPGETKCEGNNLVTCTKDKVFGKPEACAGNTVCTKKDSVYACVEKSTSLKLCSADQCVGDIWYQCTNGIYDNGTVCESGCILNTHGKYACLSTICQPGETRCVDNRIEECSDANVWQPKSPALKHAFCAVRNGAAEYVCELGYGLENGTCRPLCVEGCSEDGSMATTCPELGVIVKKLCGNGCDPETGACKDCVSGCSEDGILTICKDGEAIKSQCPAGCNAEQLKCEECVPKCAENGEYAVECKDGVPVKVTCTDGCDKNTHQCISCQTQCSGDKQHLVKCMSDGSTENEYCPYGCNAEKLECNKCENSCDGNILNECQKDGSIVSKECIFGCDSEKKICSACQKNICSAENKSVLKCDGDGGYIEEYCLKYGWKDGVCENASCVYSECADGFVLKDGDCTPSAISCDSGFIAVKLSDGWHCGISVSSKEDVIDIYKNLEQGTLSEKWKISDFSKALFVVTNSIDLGTIDNWKGIGTSKHPFTAKFVGVSKSVEIKGSLNCSQVNCGFFGNIKDAYVADMSFDINISGNDNVMGRIAGFASDTVFEYLTVKGRTESKGSRIGGLVGYSGNTDYNHIYITGDSYGNSDPSADSCFGGVVGFAEGGSINNVFVNMKIAANGNKIGGIAGHTNYVNFDSVSFIGMILPNGEKTANYVGGLIGFSYQGHPIIINSRVIAQITGSDYAAGMIGHVEDVIWQQILNSFSIVHIVSDSEKNAGISPDPLTVCNVYSLSKSFILVPGGSIKYVYYDADMVKKQDGSVSDIIVYSGSEMMLKEAEKSLAAQLNKNLEVCSPSEVYVCKNWMESPAVDLNNIVGLKEKVQLPFHDGSEFMEQEIAAIEALNNALKN